MNEKILEAKKAVVDEVTQTLVGSKCAVVISYQGLKVSELNVLRKGLKSVGATMQVHKNTLMKRAIDADGFNALDSLLKGPNALITAADPTAALPILNKFAKKNKALVIKGAIIDGTFCDTAKIQTLGALGSKEDVIAMLLSVLEAPVQRFAATVKAVAEARQ